MLIAVWQMERVVIEAVLGIPEGLTSLTNVIHCMGDVHEVFEELAGHILVGLIFLSKSQGHSQQVEAIHAHPTGAIGLFQVTARRQRRRTVENSDIVEA